MFKKKIFGIKERREYVQNLSEIKEIAADSKRTILLDNLENCEMKLNFGAELTLVALLEKGWSERKELHFNFRGEGARLNCLLLTFGKNQEQFVFDTISNHQAAGGRANYMVRSCLTDEAKVDYHGNLFIGRGADQSDAHLAHHSLLLSPRARVHTIPSLEILANDVKAGHAATMGRVDEEQLFYLESRGLDPQEAKMFLLKSFMTSDIQAIEDRELKEFLSREIERIVARV